MTAGSWSPDVCTHERAHIVDSLFFGDGYSTQASRRIFCDLCRMQRWLDVEAALALSQGEMSMIPAAAAQAIAAAARLERLDVEEMRDGVRRTHHSLVPLLTALQRACPGDTGEFVHYGATTQDVKDTGQALEMRAVLDELEPALRDVVQALSELARAHRDTVMIARTHARPALPTTFGLKTAGWIDELLRHAARVGAMRTRVLVAQLFGGVGTMAAFDGRGPQLLERFARRLGLGEPAMGWHVARDRVAEYVTTLAMLAATLARLAEELRFLSRPEIGELEEAWEPGRIGSSTMPHKRNPEGLEQVSAMARLARANVTLALDSMVQEHERDARGLRVEWVAVADTSHHTLAALSILRRILATLVVHSDRMAAHAHEASDAICSEALMLTLGRRMGKQSAHAAVYDATEEARRQGRPLRDVLGAGPRTQLDPGELDAVFDPARHLGAAGAFVDRTVAAADRWLAEAQPLAPGAVRPGMSFVAAPDEVADWRMVLAYDAAADAGVLDGLPATPAELAEQRGMDARAVRVVLDLLAVWRVVERGEDGRYALGPEAPDADLAAVLRHHARAVRTWSARIDDRLRGVAPSDPRGLAPTSRERWYAALGARARRTAPAVVDACLARLPTARRVLDLGGGHGEHALEFARRGLSVTLQDRPETIELARRGGRLEAAGVELFTGDFFDTLPQGPFDIVFAAAVTDTYDGEHNAALFRTLRPVVAPGGRLALLAFVRDRHPAVAAFAVQMLTAGKGDTHAEEDYRRWLTDAAYRDVDVVDVDGLPQSLVFATR